MNKVSLGYCPRFHHAVELIGRRWTGAIILVMLAGASRYSEMRAAIPGLSDRLLSERLRELEAEGIIERTVLPEIPPAVRYHLTAKGHALAPVIQAITTWVAQWGEVRPAEPAEAVAHSARIS
jgi:DNA-binding HxlR family transcriptional regulator